MKVILLLFAVLCWSSIAVGNPLQGIFNAENLKAAKVTGVDLAADTRPDSLILKFHPRDEPGMVVVPVPNAARDWTRYAAFTFEFSSSSTILYRLHIRNRKGEEFTYRVQPFQDVPVKVAIPNSYLTREYMNNRQFKG